MLITLNINSQYADDTEFLLAGDRESFETCITVIDNFGRKSGPCVNAGKASAVWLGSKRNLVVKYMQHLGMEWNPPKFKVLGIWFTTVKKITTQKSLQK